MSYSERPTPKPGSPPTRTTVRRIQKLCVAVASVLLGTIGTASVHPASIGPADAAPGTTTVNPTERFEQIPSPGIGFQDFVAMPPDSSRLAACDYDTTVEQAGIRGGSLYIRLLWRDLEPTEGQYAWPLMDRLFECAKERGQTVDFRLMASWPGYGDQDCWDDPREDDTIHHAVPCWLVRKGVRELEHNGVGVIEAAYVPDWEDPTIRSHHERLVRAIGQRYGNNPWLNSVDIGSVGFWGEWHTFPNDADLMPSKARRKEIIDLYAVAFPNKPLIVLAEVFKNAVNGDSEIADYLYENYAGRFGWRGDSWGGRGHHIEDYERIHAANPELWKTAPVAMEVTDVMNRWPERFNSDDDYTRVLPIDTIVGDASDWHTSLAHNKATPLPTNFVDAADPNERDLRFMATWMGARLVVDQLAYSSAISAGEQIQITSSWRNRGSAPLYHDFRVIYRLRSTSGENTVVPTSTTLKGLLPTGDGVVDETSTVAIPDSISSRDYSLEMALAHVDDVDLRMPLAITGGSDDWYPMGAITVTSDADAADSWIGGLTTSASVNGEDAWRIIDGDPSTSWSNNADPTATFSVDLGAAADVSRIRYQDDFHRNIRVTLDGVQVFNGWTPDAGEDVFAELLIEPRVRGRVLRFELAQGSWMVPEEVQVYGSGQSG